MVTLQQLNRINTKIIEADLEKLVIKDEVNGATINNITEDYRKKLIKDNKFWFVQHKQIRYQIFTKAKWKR